MINKEIVDNILECANTCKEVSNELFSLLKSGNIGDFNKVCIDFEKFLKDIQKICDNYYERKSTIRIGDAIECILYSLENVVNYSKFNIPLALHKIEFELIPFVDTMYAEYYFWSSIYPYREKWEDYYNNELPILYSNKYIDQSVESGKYKYDLSILVTGYNKVEYTKMCVESIINNLPDDISCELILLNHGSSDETREYFESIKPTKQMDIKINGTLFNAYARIIEGEFYLAISNDVIVMPNSIQNMFRAINEDISIGRVVPSTPNVSNLQTIKSECKNYDELIKWAKKNNVYNIFRHEIRTRLCDPIALGRSFIQYSKYGINIIGRYYTSADFNMFSFPDDEISMLLRRANLKNVLCKDAYCYHFGSITINDSAEKTKVDVQIAYENGRMEFKKAFGIDPWGTGYCYDFDLFYNFECKFEGHIEILGINCGMGSNSLKIKELYKEIRHNLDVSLTNFVDKEIFVNETMAISDNVYLIKEIDEIKNIEKNIYNYIVLEDTFDGYNHKLSDIELLSNYLIDTGELYVKCDGMFESNKFKKIECVGRWTKFIK